MNNEISILAGSGLETNNVVKAVKESVKKPVKALTGYYSQVLGEPVSTVRTAWLLGAQAAFFAAVLPADMSAVVRLALLACAVVCFRRQS